MGFPTTATIWAAISRRRAVVVALVVGLAAVLAGFLLVETPFDMAEILLLIPCYWVVFLIPSLPVCLAVWFFGRKRVQWSKWDFLILLVPYVVWMVLGFVPNIPKSLSNVAVELFGLGLAVDATPILRFVLPKRWNGQIVAATLLVLACAVAAGIYFSVPCLPE